MELYLILYIFIMDIMVNSMLVDNSAVKCGINSDCSGGPLPLFKTLDPFALCGTDTSVKTNKTIIHRQVIHLNILKIQNISLQIGPSFVNDLNITSNSCTNYFTSCRRSDRPNYHTESNGRLIFKNFTDNSYVLLLSGTIDTQGCYFQFQINVTTYDRNCTNIDDCTSNLCIDNSACVNKNSSSNETVTINCTLVSCYDDQTCIFHNGSHLCKCPSEFNKSCSKDNNNCISEPCLNNGTCFSVPESTNYTCKCLKGFMGRNCEEEIDYCSKSPCMNNGTCTINHTLGMFECICLTNYTGKYCEHKLTNPCLSSPCLQKQICVPGKNNTFECQCQFAFAGKTCDQFNCPCTQNGRCKRDSASELYRCECNKGYGGLYCEVRLGDCHSDTSEECYEQYLCTDTDYGYTCICPPHLEGEKCNLKFICSEKISPCQNGGYCRQIVGSKTSHKCHCPTGYTGLYCEIDVNECLGKPCGNNGVCVEDEINSFTCYCKPGFCGANCADICLTGEYSYFYSLLHMS